MESTSWGGFHVALDHASVQYVETEKVQFPYFGVLVALDGQ
jgi:hypothetical protein